MTLSSLVMPAGVFIIILGLAGLVFSFMQDRKRHGHVRERLHVRFDEPEAVGITHSEDKKRREAEIADKAARRAAEFYASADPENVVRLRQTLMRAGYLDPDAVGKFFLVRFAAMGGGLLLGILMIVLMHVAPVSQRGVMTLAGFSIGGYFLPAFALKQQVSKRVTDTVTAFPTSWT